MKTRILKLFFTLALLAGVYQTNANTVFPIATNHSVVEFSGGTAFDGTNYFVIIVTGANGASLVGQFFSTNGTLIGSQISIGSNVGFPPATALTFGKTNYLVAWSDSSVGSGVDMYGQFISRSGAKVGSKFNLLSSQGSHGFQAVKALACDGTNFLAVWQDNNDRSFYGQLIAPAGTLSGSAFLISSQEQNGKDAAVTWGKTNYLVVWQSNNGSVGNVNQAFGEFVSRNGSAGSPFQIGQTSSVDQNPLAVAFDGENYFAVWPWDPAPQDFSHSVTNWDLRGRLISQTGTFPGNELDVITDPGSEVFPSLAFDGSNFLLACGELNYNSDVSFNPTNSNIYFQFFNQSGSAVGAEFTVFTAQSTNIPFLPLNGLIFDGNRYAIAGSLGTITISGGNITGFPSGEVYGAFISPSVFPIATNASTVDLAGTATGLASSGTNVLVSYLAGTNVCVQLVFTDGTRLGPPVTNGVSSKFPKVAYAGGNYLLFWFDNFADNLHAQLISANGAKIGSSLSLGPAESQGAQALLSDGTKFLLVFEDNTSGYYHGQFVTSAGALSGSSFLIASESVDLAGAYGAGNYFFEWQNFANGMSPPYNTYGVLVSGSGSVGSPFQINQTGSLDHSLPAVGFDGTNFLAVWNGDTAQTASGAPIWNFYGRLVSQSGNLISSELLLNSNQPALPSLAFDGTDYLLGWGFDDNTTNSDKNVFCQFLDRSANPVGSSFAPFPSQGTNSPLYGNVIFDGQDFVMAATIGSISVATNGSIKGFPSGAVYGAFISTNTSFSTNGAPATGNLVANGGFETGDFTGWNLSGSDTGDIFVDDGSQTGIEPHSGTYLAALGPVGSLSYLSQTLSTVPGQSYVLSLWLNSPDGLTPNEFAVSWNESTIFDQIDMPAIVWTNLQFTVTATGTSTVLQFGARDDNSYLGLDDISVQPSGATSPTIQFTATPTNGAPPLAVQFNSPNVDSSGTNIISCNWNFGDGSTSFLQSPSHTYTNVGTFTPTLVATNVNGVAVSGFGPQISSLPPISSTDFTYITNNGTITITGYIGTNDTVTIPGTINGLPVTDIGSFAFDSYSITNVTIPDTVIRIEDWAFQVGFASVTIPNSVTSIGSFVFVNCYNLNSITIPSSVTSIGEAPFASDNSLVAITVDTANAYYTSVGGVLFDKSQTTLIQYPEGNTATSYIIPNEVTIIGGNALGASSLTSVMIPNSVTSIGQEAFAGSRLSSVIIPNSVVSIGAYAFQYTLLTSVEIPSSVTDLGQWPFDDCTSLTAINVDSNNPAYSSVGGVLFDKSLATLLEYPAGATASTYSVPTSVTSIGVQAFQDCASLTSITVPNSVASIGGLAFSNCANLTSLYFEGNPPSADSSTFDGDFATVYYLPGTTGWDTTYEGLPTALWMLPYPIILTNTSGLGVQTNGFSFDVSWATNLSVVVEACTNLSNPIWLPLKTNALTGGVFYFSDSKWTNYHGRFYRIRSP